MPRFIPNNPPPENRGCPVSGKRMFDTEAEALREADWILKNEGRALDVYLCLSCDRWHFTSTKRI